MKKRLQICSVVLFGFAAVCSVSGFLNSTIWLFNLCAQFRIAYLVLFALYAAYFLIRRQPRFAIAAIVLSLLNIFPIANPPPHARFVSSQDAATAAPLRVLQMNQWVNNKDYQHIVDFILSQHPNVVAIEEYTADADRQLTKLGLWKVFPYHVSVNNNGPDSQIALLSQFPFKKTQIEYTYASKDPCIIAEIDYATAPLTIVVMHPRPPATPALFQRQCNHLTHLAAQRDSFAKSLIVTGDLNTTPWTTPFTDFIHRTNLTDSRPPSDPASTWPAWIPFLPIDYVLLSSDLNVRSFNVIGGSGSDHKSLLVQIIRQNAN